MPAEPDVTTEHDGSNGDMPRLFVAMVSHEFRTPLTAIMASCELLQHYSDRLSEAESREELVSIEREVDRLTRMIEEVIVLGQADTTGLDFRPGPVDMQAKLNELADRALSPAPAPATFRCMAQITWEPCLPILNCWTCRSAMSWAMP